MTQTDTWTENIELARKLSEKRSEINYFEDKVPSYELPPLMKDDDGRTITTTAQWAEKRAKLLDLFRNELYGYSPERPKDEWFEIAKIDRQAMGGAATLKLVNIHLGAQPEAPVIHLNLFIPNNRTKPAPAFLLICNRDRENIDPTRKIKSDFWPAEQIVARGYAAASFFNGDVAPDKYDGFTTGIHA